MSKRARRALVSIGSCLLVVATAAFRPSDSALCAYSCGLEECPSDMQQQCEMYCGTSLWVCGNVEWCGGELGYHCGPL